MSTITPLLPHGPLVELAPGLWSVEGSLANMALNRHMVLWRAPDGGLVVHSGIRLDDATIAAVEALGPVRWILVPNQGHRLDAPWWRARYPEAKVLAPANARAKVEEVVPVDQTCEEALPGLGVRLHRPAGMQEGYELVYELDLPGGGRALVINDVLSLPKPIPGLGGMIVRILGPAGGQLGLPRIVRFFFGKDMAAFRGFVERLAAIPDLRVLAFSHGQHLVGDGNAALAAAAARM